MQFWGMTNTEDTCGDLWSIDGDVFVHWRNMSGDLIAVQSAARDDVSAWL